MIEILPPKKVKAMCIYRIDFGILESYMMVLVSLIQVIT